MRIDGYSQPKSSFLSMEKDTSIIINKMLGNERLKRLLYYTTSDALTKPNITQAQSLELISKNIKIVPKLKIDTEVLNYVFVSFNNFAESSNPEFRDNMIEFDILCHFDQWQLTDFALRPFKIAGEIDSMFNHEKLTGLGTLNFSSMSQIVLSDEFGGLCLLYNAVHGEEDKKGMPNPQTEEQFLKDFASLKNGI